MKNGFLSLALLLVSMAMDAQSTYYTNLQNELASKYKLSGGLWLLPADETQALNTISGYGGTLSANQAISGQPFSRFRQMTISGAGENPWSSGLSCSNKQTISKGSNCFMVIWMRSATAETAKVNLFLERSQTFEKEIFLTLDLSSSWKQYIAPFDAGFDYEVGQLNFGLHTAFKAQTIQIAGIALIDFKTAYTLDRFPINLHINYVGSEPNAPWRAEAAQRIEQIRKADLSVSVTKANGDPVQGASVKLEMLEHEFKFGSAINASRIAGNRQQNNTYQQKILDFDGKGHGFNEVVFENDMKWDAWEQNWSVTPPELVKAVTWLKDRGIPVRGHTLVWPGWRWMPPDMRNNQTNPSYLMQRVNSRLNEILNYPGIRGVVKEWDVLNEITFNEDLAKALAGKLGYTTGREVYVDIIKKVRETDPSVKVYLNDYSTIDQGNLPGNPVYDRTIQYFKEIQNAGIKIDGIGFQGHISAGLVSIPYVKTVLDDFYNKFGARAKITEYDYGSLVNDSLAGRFTADFLTMCFSHPSVDGFLSWGFWQGAHWLNNGPFFRQDWSMRPAGQAVADLLFNQWWTNTTVSSNAAGLAQARGFKGRYRITVSLNGKVGFTDTISLTQNSTLKVSLPVSVSLNKAPEEERYLQFQNPVEKASVVSVTCSEDPRVAHVLDLQGRVLLQVNHPGKSFNILTPYVPGMYILRVQLENGEFYGQKLLVR